MNLIKLNQNMRQNSYLFFSVVSMKDGVTVNCLNLLANS